MWALYDFTSLLSLCISAVLSGYTQYRQIADWISKLPGSDRVKFGLPGDRTPEESTISKFLRKIDPVELDTVLSAWLLKTFDQKKIETVLIDGKALRGTSSDSGEQKSFLNVFANELGIVITHLPTKKGAGEKAQAREVVENESIPENATVIADALHTDKKFVSLLEKKRSATYSLSRVIKAL